MVTDHVLTGVGAQLKEAREAAGLAIDDVARQLKLLPRQIESLEGERFDRLPGPAIARGMVRNYARLLELNAEPLMQRMAPPVEEAQQPTARRRPTLLLYTGFFVVLLALAGVVAYEWPQEKTTPESAAAIPAPPVPERKPVEEPAAQPVDVPAASEKPKVEAAAEPPVLPPGIHRLVLRMEAQAWLEVRDGSGRSLVSSLNPAGSERAVRGQPPFQLVIGNAAHVKLTYDGKPVDLAPHIRGDVARLTLP
jgi:cytoskeleton protein RodZ